MQKDDRDPAGDRFQEETLRLTRLLSAVIKVSGRTRLGLEQQLGLSRGALSKVLGGSVELRLRQLFQILDAVGVEPEEFFRMAYPRRRAAGGEGSRRLLDDLEAALGAGPGFDPEPGSPFDERIRRSLARLLGLGPDADRETT